jgi:hypothetical protein
MCSQKKFPLNAYVWRKTSAFLKQKAILGFRPNQRLVFICFMFLMGFKMTGEFRKRIELLGFDEQTKKKVIDLFKEAQDEFPCLACPSKDTCENFKWYIKWFSG